MSCNTNRPGEFSRSSDPLCMCLQPTWSHEFHGLSLFAFATACTPYTAVLGASNSSIPTASHWPKWLLPECWEWCKLWVSSISPLSYNSLTSISRAFAEVNCHRIFRAATQNRCQRLVESICWRPAKMVHGMEGMKEESFPIYSNIPNWEDARAASGQLQT